MYGYIRIYGKFSARNIANALGLRLSCTHPSICTQVHNSFQIPFIFNLPPFKEFYLQTSPIVMGPWDFYEESHDTMKSQGNG